MAGILRVIYLLFTQGHYASGAGRLVRADLCDQATRLARRLAPLMPDKPEAAGLLAMMLLTDARREARTDSGGAVVPLRYQDRGKWDRAKIAEGTALLDAALRSGQPAPIPAARRDCRLPFG